MAAKPRKTVSTASETLPRNGQPVDPADMPEAIRAALELQSREPFRDPFVNFLLAAPDLAALKSWAVKTPDRWTQGLAILGRLNGYTEKLDVGLEGSSTLIGLLKTIEGASDAELLQRRSHSRPLAHGLGGDRSLCAAAPENPPRLCATMGFPAYRWGRNVVRPEAVSAAWRSGSQQRVREGGGAWIGEGGPGRLQQVRLRLDPAELGGLDEAVEEGGDLGATGKAIGATTEYLAAVAVRSPFMLATLDLLSEAFMAPASIAGKGPPPRAAPQTVIGVWRIAPSGNILAPLRPMVP